MVDSISVIGPGWRAADNNGDIITDGIMAFFDAGTTTPKTVYSDSGLSTSLGTTVNCNSAGYPVTGANAKTLIYVGSAAYKIRLTSILFGGTVWEHDDVKGALDTSTFLTSSFTPSKSVVAEPNDRTIVAADKGKLIDVDCSSATRTMTLDDASDLGDGFWVCIRHNGSANQVKITGNGADTFGLNGVDTTGFSLTGRGQVAWIACNGAGFKVDGQVDALIGHTTGTILVADRLSTPPGSPAPGARYILTSAPTGAWSGFAEHDIAEADGFGTWFRYTPTADAGWVAYVQDEDRLYGFIASTWKEIVSNIGALTAATALAEGDLFVIERSGVNLKADRSLVGRRFIESGTVSSAATKDFAIPADCDEMVIDLWNWRPATDNVFLYLRFSQSAAFLSGASDYKWGADIAASNGNDAADNQIVTAQQWGNAAGEYGHMHITISRPSAAATPKIVMFQAVYHNINGVYIAGHGGGELIANTNAIDGVRLFYSSGNIAEGFYTVSAYRYA